ncbi:hypothetical protein ACLKA6_012828 [Drosophila palustris]
MYVEVANSFSNEYKGWCLDSGATSHMCSQKERFENVSAAKCPQLKLANGESTDTEGCGLVPFNPSNKYSANLVNTLYVPELRENLLSVSKICDHGFNILFKKDRAEILRGSNGQIVFTAKRKQDLYHVEESGEFGHVAIGKQTNIKEWHERFGHLNEKDLKEHLRTFGQIVYSLDKRSKSKFSARSKNYIFIGYCSNAKAYRLFDPETRIVSKSRDVVFTNKFDTNCRFEEFLEQEENIETEYIPSEQEEEYPDEDNEQFPEETRQQVISKRGPGRPRKLHTGKPGRPKLVYNEVIAETHDSGSESEGEEFFEATSLISSNEVTANAALKGPHALEWKEAFMNEYKALQKNKTWEIVKRQENQRVIDTRWVLRTKYKANGEIDCRKARLVAKGFTQREGIDYTETFSPVARIGSIRALIAIAVEFSLDVHQFDFNSAYLNGEIEKDIYINVPPEFDDILTGKEKQKYGKNNVCKLKKALYGLKQSGRQWYKKLDNKLKEMELNPIAADPCVYLKKKGNGIIIVSLYVDDLFVATNDAQMLKNLKSELSSNFEMKDLGKLSYCLGIEFNQNKEKKSFSMSQPKYIKDLLKQFNMEDCKTTSTPINTSEKLSTDMCPKNEAEKEEASKLPYQNLVGALMWLAVSTRPDIAHAETDTPQKSGGILDSSTSAAAAALKPGQCSNATTAMVTMPAGHANAGAGPSKPAFHPGLGVDGVILPPPDALKSKQSAKSAAESPVGAGTVGKPPTASVGERFSFTEKRSAGHVLQRHYAHAGSNLSADWLKKVEWAKQVLPDYAEQSPRAQAQAKRQRSQEAPGPSAKKSRVQPGRSFAQIAKERILIGVLDQGNADGRIPRNQWKWVETALATRCFEMLDSEPGPPPICKDVGWYQGNVKVIACDDERSAELYKAAVSKIGEVYPGAKLVAIDWKDVPVRPRARLWIPSSMKEPDKLLLMLQRCNPSLPTHDWKVAKIEEMPGPTSQAVIILNKESLAPIDAAGGELNFGFSSVFIRVYKSDATPANGLSDKPAEEDITEELEAPERPEMDGYVSDASTITRELSALCTMADREVTLDVAPDDEDANQTVVEVLSSDVPKDIADKPPSLTHNVNWAINSFQPFKSPGPDGISPAHLQYAGNTATNWLQALPPSPVNRLLCDIEGGGCQLVAYADDVAMIFTGKYPQTLCDLMTVKLINLAAWADKCGLGVNPDKTELVLFSRRYKEDWSLEPPGQPDALAFYTDGSKLNNKVGGGVHSPILGIDHSFRLPDHCSVFQAEILAINESLKLLQRSNTAYGRINIYSDSQAAIKSIAATTTKSTSVSNCRRSLHEMAEFFDICLIWVPGHKDIPGNCIADELARRGTTDILLPDKEDISMPLATCKLMLHSLLIAKHSERWHNTPTCRVARQSWPRIDRARSKALCDLSRTECSHVVRSLTGHWLVGIHALRLKAPYNDFCRSCRDEEEDECPEHFFCFCPALSNRRLRTLGKPFLDNLSELATLAPRKIAHFVQLSKWTPF